MEQSAIHADVLWRHIRSVSDPYREGETPGAEIQSRGRLGDGETLHRQATAAAFAASTVSGFVAPAIIVANGSAKREAWVVHSEFPCDACSRRSRSRLPVPRR